MEVERVQSEHPDALVEVWCEDEHRIGLQPVNRRIWVEEASQPVAVVNWKRSFMWLYAFVQPQTGETYWWILPYVNTELFSRVLKDEAQHFGLGKDKQIVLPLDQAGWHSLSAVRGASGNPSGASLAIFPGVATGGAAVATGR